MKFRFILSIKTWLLNYAQKSAHHYIIGKYHIISFLIHLKFKSRRIRFCYSIECILHSRYAGLQNATKCFCGTSFGRYGPGKCTKRCQLNQDQNTLSICGGESSNTVYSTGVKVPGPPSNLHLNQSNENRLSISWTPFSSRPSKFVTGYHIYVALNKSFDRSVGICSVSIAQD